MHCDFVPHAGEFPDKEFWLRDDGQWIHDVDPQHTAKGRLVFESPDAAPESARVNPDPGPDE